ncbi:hypothetical protein LRS06_18860 [Hymenobacter sp. J193]|uniref:hypothetical protein n=1 Tax=Hymenobacter sp. J193 TaxID=2898429 RepID=UPI0021513D3B|nr:hypothetical protein [Hymenobacter sp. J193]MCR5889792.1 hypothetical protein [Hymenobacter sp. J193]
MNKVLLVLALAVGGPVSALAQTYYAQNADPAHKVKVPAYVVKKFSQAFPGAPIDSCYVFGNTDKGEESYSFFTHRVNRVLEANFNERGELTESATEVSVESLPDALQAALTPQRLGAARLGRVTKTVYHQEANRVEYRVECLSDDAGKSSAHFQYFTEDGQPISAESRE